MRTRIISLAFAVAGSFSSVARADGPATGNPEPTAFPEGAYRTFVERVNAAQSSAYAATIREFDSYLSGHPGDAVAAVEKCRFIANFADSEDQVIPSSSADLEACRTDLSIEAFAASEDVLLYQAQADWSDGATGRAEALLAKATAKPWTAAHRAALHEHLNALYNIAGNKSLKAGEHAWAAVRLNPASKLRLAAAEYLVQTGARKPAITLLGPDDSVAWSEWEVGKVATLLISVGEPQRAREIIERQAVGKLSAQTRVLLAGLLAGAGELPAARKLLDAAAAATNAPGPASVQTLRDRFRLERDFGDRNSAAAAYRDLRHRGWSADPLARDRLSLLATQPSLPFTAADLLGVATFAAVLLLAALTPVIVIAPIHYRSAVKQVGGLELPDAGPWGLGHLWYALGAMVVAGVIAAYVFDYRMIETKLLSDLPGARITPETTRSIDVGRTLILETALMLLALVPLLVTRAQREAIRGRWSLLKSVLVGVGSSLGLLMATGLIVLVFKRPHAAAISGALGSETTRAVQGIRTQYGVLAVVLVVCVMVPVIEEIVFRGVFLQAARRRLAFWAAALVQALVFAVLHEEPGVMASIFVLALVAAWLARRSDGLLAPMVLHGTNNAFALLAITQQTALLNGTS